MYQQTTLLGYLGRDPEMRFTQAGQPMTTFSVATSRKVQGEDETTWFRVTVFGKQAEACNDYLQTGALVLVTGRLRPDEHGNPEVYKRKDGTPAASFNITAYDVRFISGTKDRAVEENVDDYLNENIPF